MRTIFELTAPFYGLILLGYLSLYFKLLNLDAIKPLNTFVLYIALPAMLFRFGVQLPIAQLLDFSSFLIYGLSAALLVAGSIVWSLRFELPKDSASTGFAALVAVFPNTGFLGLPLLTTLLGAQAAGPILVSLVFDLVITSTVCIAWALWGQTQAQNAAHTSVAGWRTATRLARQLGLGLLKNPMPWAILAGAWCSWLELEPSKMVQGVVYRIADASSPVALFMIGAVIYRALALAAQHRAQADTTRRGPSLHWRLIVPYASIKLWLHPLLIALLALSSPAWGLSVPASTFVTLVLLAALPSGSNVSLLAERMDGNSDRVALVILLTTLLALPSFTLIAALLGVQV